ncbi:MAG: hypothetical protein ACRERV_03330, partial [Methylococcales bacterium]
MKSGKFRFKLKVPVALILISAAMAPSTWAVQRPSLDAAPMPNYDVRVGYSSLNINDPGLKKDLMMLRTQKSRLLSGASSTNILPVVGPDRSKFKELFGKGVTASFNATGAPSFLFSEEGALTEPLNVSAENAARLFLQNYEEVFGLNLQEITDLEVVRIVNSASGSKQVNLRQTVDGLPVFGADFKVGLDKDHAVLSSGGSLYPGLQVSGKASLTVAELVERAAQTVGEWSSDGLPKSAGRVWDNTVYLKDWSETSLAKARKNIAFEPRVLKMDNTPEHRTIVSRGPFQSDIAASQVIFPLTKTQGRLAWRISLHKSMTEWYQVIVDAEDGSLLNRTNLVQFADEQANVFTRNPNATPLSARSLLGTAPATSGSYAFAGSSGQAGNNVFMMIGANEKPGTIHDYTFPFTDSYLNTGALQTIDLATNRKLAFAPNASGGYNMTKAALTAVPAGTNLAMTDDSAVCAPLPFAFQFFG